MKQYKLISVCSFILLSSLRYGPNQGVPEGSNHRYRQAIVEKLSIEDFSWLNDAFNGGQIKPTYLVTDAPEAKTAEIFNKLKTIGFLLSKQKTPVIPAKYAWTGAKVFIKTFFSEIVLSGLAGGFVIVAETENSAAQLFAVCFSRQRLPDADNDDFD